MQDDQTSGEQKTKKKYCCAKQLPDMEGMHLRYCFKWISYKIVLFFTHRTGTETLPDATTTNCIGESLTSYIGTQVLVTRAPQPMKKSSCIYEEKLKVPLTQ